MEYPKHVINCEKFFDGVTISTLMLHSNVLNPVEIQLNIILLCSIKN
jgi:hypothetical protein